MTPERILCVDDDPLTLVAIEKDLRGHFPVITALSGEQALALIQNQGPFGVILADMVMDGMTGVELLAQAQRVAPDTVRMMLTGDKDKQTAVEAINEGRIFRFLSKPCPAEKMIAALNAGLEQYRLVIAERQLLEETLNGSVKMFTEVLSTREPESFGRGQKICEYVRLVAPALKLNQIWDIEVAAMLARIGWLALPPRVLHTFSSGEPLNPRESDMVARVPEFGYNVLSKIPRLEPAARIVLFQSKNFDGSGFPKGSIPNDQIPAGSRLLKILSDFVELETKGATKKRAADLMQQNLRFYDPVLLEKVMHVLVAEETLSPGTPLRVSQLLPGQVMLSSVETLDGQLIVAAGTVLSPMMLERFANFAELSGIKEPIYVRRK
ncbi:MAG: response regulator [Verrucomicrobia bacterium]|nr:response regulator [Verrucomicrobiota bacterium]